MKKISTLLLLGLLGFVGSHAQNTFPATGSAGIGTAAPNAKAALDVVSTTQGVLLPRMTAVQRGAILTPPIGLLVYQIDGTKGLYQYSGTAWIAVSPSTSTLATRSLNNLTAPTAINQSLLPGTTNAIDLGSATNAWKNGFFSGNLTLANGTQGAGKVLTSDANGLASWQTPSGGSWIASGNNISNSNSGNVGIGTNAPTLKLDIVAPAGTDALGLTRGGSNGWKLGPASGTGDESKFGIVDGGTGRLVIDGSGNVGIGTTTPVDKLSVQTASENYGISHTDGSTTIGTYVGSNGGFLGTRSNHSLGFFTDNGNGGIQMAISTNGNVGIGTTTPAAKLDVAGNVKIADGTQGAGKVLTSDSAGLASWASLPAAAASWNRTGNGGTAVTNFLGTTDNRSLRIRTNNVQRAIIDSVGNVGIGTNAPSSLLSVGSASGSVLTPTAITMDNTYGSTVAWDKLKFYLFKSGVESYGLGLGVNQDVQYWAGANNTGVHRFFTAQQERMRIDGGGKVGIGTIAPTENLSVRNPDGSPTMISSSTTDNHFLNFFSGSLSDNNSAIITDNGQAMRFGQWNSLSGKDGFNERMRIEANGSVGIGTSAPLSGSKLMIAAGLGAQWGDLIVNSNNAGGVGGKLTIANFAGGVGAQSALAFATNPGTVFGANGENVNDAEIRAVNVNNSNGATDLRFSNWSGTAINTNMVINSQGNVSIGTPTSATGYKLTVAGKVICTELKVQVQPFPDYVFAGNYKLPSLKEVESHINTYHRLPGMPSATEVEADGMEVGKMQTKVVEKVEEATLYILQLSKENEALKNQLTEQGKAIAALQAAMKTMQK